MNLRGLIGRLQVSGLDREAAGFRGLIVRLRVWGLIVRCEGLIVRCIKAQGEMEANPIAQEPIGPPNESLAEGIGGPQANRARTPPFGDGMFYGLPALS